MSSTVKKGRAGWKTAAIRALSVLVYPPDPHARGLGADRAWYLLAPVLRSPAEGGAARNPASAGFGAIEFTAERVTRLTDSGAADTAALSSDGRYVVHVKLESGLRSVWVRQTATTSDVQIVPPAEADILGVTFSPDGEHVYYVSRLRADARTVLYRIATLGGMPSRVLEDITSAPGFSPEGGRMAFVRGRTDLIVSGTDGTDAHKLASVLGEYFFWSGRTTEVAWSPDGRTILVPACRREMKCSVLAVDARTGTIKEVSGGWIWLNSVKWMPDGRSFITDGPMASRTSQLWQVRYPSGERRRVTNDLNGYEFASLSGDGRLLATVQYTDEAKIWMVSAGRGKAKALVLRPGSGFGANGIAWTPDGRYLVFAAEAAGRYQLWIAPATGGEARQLTNHETGFAMPAVPGRLPGRTMGLLLPVR